MSSDPAAHHVSFQPLGHPGFSEHVNSETTGLMHMISKAGRFPRSAVA